MFLSMQIGWFISAGDKVINQDGAPTYDIKDHTLLRMYFLELAISINFLHCELAYNMVTSS